MFNQAPGGHDIDNADSIHKYSAPNHTVWMRDISLAALENGEFTHYDESKIIIRDNTGNYNNQNAEWKSFYYVVGNDRLSWKNQIINTDLVLCLTNETPYLYYHIVFSHYGSGSSGDSGEFAYKRTGPYKF